MTIIQGGVKISGYVKFSANYVPDPPTDLKATWVYTSTVTTVTLNLKAPNNVGSGAITSYTAYSNPPGYITTATVAPTAPGATITIPNFDSTGIYELYAYATNFAGDSVASTASNLILPNLFVNSSTYAVTSIGAPGTPTVVSAVLTLHPVTGSAGAVISFNTGSQFYSELVDPSIYIDPGFAQSNGPGTNLVPVPPISTATIYWSYTPSGISQAASGTDVRTVPLTGTGKYYTEIYVDATTYDTLRIGMGYSSGVGTDSLAVVNWYNGLITSSGATTGGDSFNAKYNNGAHTLMLAWNASTSKLWIGFDGVWQTIRIPGDANGITIPASSGGNLQIVFASLGSGGGSFTGHFRKPSKFTYAIPAGFTGYNNVNIPTLSYTAISSPGNITVTTSTVNRSAKPSIYLYGLSPLTAYTFRVSAANLGGATEFSTSSVAVTTYVEASAQAYTASGSYTWKKPSGVTNVSVVAIGGGGPGGYTSARNAYSSGATAGGNSYFWLDTLVKGYGAGLGGGGGYTGDGGGNGGSANPVGYSNMFGCCGYYGASAGGGAGGYAGTGGAGGLSTTYVGGAGAGGGAGGGSWSVYGAAGGGGVGIYGQGANGAGGLINIVCAQNTGGFGGSGGLNGKPHGVAGSSQTAGASGGGMFGGGGGGITGAGGNGSGTFGGGGGGLGYKNNIVLCVGVSCYTVVVGAGGANSYNANAYGSGGAVRIVWPGQLRSFPSTFVNCFAAASTTTQFAPCSPTIGAAVANSGTRVTVAYTAPSFVGGSAITSFTAVSTPGNIKATTATASSGVIAVEGLTPLTAYTFKVYATNSYGSSPYSSASASTTTYVAAGSVIFAIPGSYTWVAPSNVSNISVVAVSGGGSGKYGSGASGDSGDQSYFWSNASGYLAVTGGAVGAQAAAAGGTVVSGAGTGFAGGTGGAGTRQNQVGGGGGAGGYGGVGGAGASGNVSNSSAAGVDGDGAGVGSGAGGGGANVDGDFALSAAGGGGVGLFGLGLPGAGGVACCSLGIGTGGRGGSGGLAGQDHNAIGCRCAGHGGLFGGGGGGYKAGSGTGGCGGGGGGGALAWKNNWTVTPGDSYPVVVGAGGQGGGGNGGGGAVRIVWPGQVRQFPSTGVHEKWGNDPTTIASGYVPNAPTIISAVANSATSVSVTWNVPVPIYFSSDIVTSYTIKETTTGIIQPVTTASRYTGTVLGTVNNLSPLTTYSFVVYANNIYGVSTASLAVSTTTYVAAGSAVYAQPGSYTWVAPVNVTSVSVVAVGGGGGGSSNILSSCDGGDSYFYNTGLLNALGGDASVQTGCNDKPASYQNPGSNAGTASYSGGTRDNNPVNKHGGTGAGGYTGAGGGTGAASTGGGGGGAGCGPGPYLSGGGGGGVGLFGSGSNGAAGVNCTTVGDNTGGTGGSGGTNGGCSTISGGQYYSGHGGKFGGGGGGGRALSGGGGGSLSYLNNYTVTPGNSYNLVVGAGGAPMATSYSCTWGGKGGDGGVRIVWPGAVRRFPNTNVNQGWGYDDSTFALTYLPNSPAVVSATAIDQTSVSISWIDPLNRLVNPDASSRNQNTDLKITSYTAVSVACGKTATVSTSGSYNAVISGLTTSTSYSFYVYATNSYGNSTASNVVSTTTWYANGHAVFTTVGLNTFIVPMGVTSISVVAVGGGGGGGSSSNAPHQGVASYFGGSSLLQAGGGAGMISACTVMCGACSPVGGVSSGSARTGGGAGGRGGYGYNGGGQYRTGSGGGAGGYSGNGGAGGSFAVSPTAGSGGGGGAGGAGSTCRLNDVAYGGGGVSIYGQGCNGVAGIFSTNPLAQLGGGGGGCGASSTGKNGALYGGGGAGAQNANYSGGGGGALAYMNNYDTTALQGTSINVYVGAGGAKNGTSAGQIAGCGAQGIVRVVWPGQIRQFPSTRVSAASSTACNVPYPPSISSLTVNSGTSVTVSYTASSWGGASTVTSFTAVATPGNITRSVSTSGSGSIVVNGLSPLTAYSFSVYATNSYGNSTYSVSSNATTLVASGEAVFTTVGLNTFIVPMGVTSISVVAVGGGGGGGTSASASHQGGASYFGSSGLLQAGGGAGTTNCVTCAFAPAAGGTSSGSGRTGGGAGGAAGSSYWSSYTIYRTSTGGGAGGYSGAGGAGGSRQSCTFNFPTAGSGGGGGGGGAKSTAYKHCSGYGGGGVNVYGLGASGAAGVMTVNPCESGGGGGSCGATSTGKNGALYGGGASGGGYTGNNGTLSGGGGGALAYMNNYNTTALQGTSINVYVGAGGTHNGAEAGCGAQGIVRIVWPGQARQFPSTLVGPSTNY